MPEHTDPGEYPPTLEGLHALMQEAERLEREQGQLVIRALQVLLERMEAVEGRLQELEFPARDIQEGGE